MSVAITVECEYEWWWRRGPPGWVSVVQVAGGGTRFRFLLAGEKFLIPWVGWSLSETHRSLSFHPGPGHVTYDIFHTRVFAVFGRFTVSSCVGPKYGWLTQCHLGAWGWLKKCHKLTDTLPWTSLLDFWIWHLIFDLFIWHLIFDVYIWHLILDV